MEDYKKHKSKFSVGKSNCTKAMKKSDNAFKDFCKNKGSDIPTMRRVRFADELMEAVEFSKSKIKELAKIVDNFIAVITDLDESNFTDPDKEAVLKKVQSENHD